ncbi:MAG: antibiotic biosynthesis monooxygenase [Spirochaetales bacterium]|nr:antibiotic biosynthesis monooxygenase [Spirochaetales bacterium]
MLIVHVDVQVKMDSIDAFLVATKKNARESLKEPGIVRFDVLQNRDDPTRFVLNEVYRADEDPARHKETEHYKTWRAAVEDMMARPRGSVKYSNCFPADLDW